MPKIAALLVALLVTAGPARCDPIQVLGMEAEKTGMGWRISVTLRHNDEDWEHYADAWRVETHDGKVLGLRELLHPHTHEQPFTRSLASVMIPDGTREIFVRAHDTLTGWDKTATAFPLVR